MASQNHVHRYERVDIGVNKKYEVYKCTLPDCPHYISEALVVGRKSICWRCGNVFTIQKNLLFKKPHCSDCIERKVDEKTKETIDKFIEEFTLPNVNTLPELFMAKNGEKDSDK
jgi:hypothetical protein